MTENDSKVECFVVNCKNEVGASFPKDDDLKSEWLKALNVDDEIEETSFVCWDHFNDADIQRDSNGEPKLKKGAIPRKIDEESEESRNSDDDIKGEAQPREHSSSADHKLPETKKNTSEVITKLATTKRNTPSIIATRSSTAKKNPPTEIETKDLETYFLVFDDDDGQKEHETLSEIELKSSDTKDSPLPEIKKNISLASTTKKSPIKVISVPPKTPPPIIVTRSAATKKYPPSAEKRNLRPKFVYKSVDLKTNQNDNEIARKTSKTTPETPKTDSESDEEDLIEQFTINLTKPENCRLCMETTDVPESIFKNIDKDETISIMTAINMCLNPVKVNVNDNFPKKICPKCLMSLRACYKFKTSCLTVDNKRRKEAETRKRKAIEMDDPPPGPNQRPKVHLIGPGPKLQTAVKKLTPAMISRQMEIDQKFDKVEAELRKVLEGQLTEEQLNTTDNIIMVVTSDDEGDDHKETKVVLPIKEDTQTNTENGEKAIIKTNNTNIVLPKGIRVTIPEKFESSIGEFECKLKEYICDTIFCEADDYLLEYRLQKGLFRHLRCIHSNCTATGLQTKHHEEEAYENIVTITRAHNHPKPTVTEMQKQMFYYVIKKKIRADRTLNFRAIYDDVCACDMKIRDLLPLRTVINEMCRYQLSYKCPELKTFDDFFDHIENDTFQRLHYTTNSKQFYQERFVDEATDSKAIIFANCEVIRQLSDSKLMYVDSSFKIDSNDTFDYQLVTVLVWMDDSYYPIFFAVINQKTQEIYRKIFEYLHDVIAPKLRPAEIVTDYEGSIYYALGETYLDSHIGGSVFYYTQNLYKKVCSLNMSRQLETNSYYRNIYHMLLMLPLLPVNTITDGLVNIQSQAHELGVTDLTQPLFDHIQTQWIERVTPDLFCVHRLENRINENVIAPFKKLRDFLMLSKGKVQKRSSTIVHIIEKLIELDGFLQQTYSAPSKKSFARDLSCSQKKNVLRAWQYIEHHPKININSFFNKVLGYIRCMENQLWIWGFYRFKGNVTEELINAANFSIVSNDFEVEETVISNDIEEEDDKIIIESNVELVQEEKNQIVVDGVIDENGQIVVKKTTPFENAFVQYICKK